MAATLREHLLARGLAPRSVYRYLLVIDRAQQWFATKAYDLDRATSVEAAEYLETLPRTNASRKLARAGLGHYWEWAGHPTPPLRALRVPPKPEMVCRAVEPEEGRLLAKAARNRGDAKGLAVCIGLYLGLRREEIATLRWSCFDGSGWVKVTGKGERTRTLPVHPVLGKLLDEHPRSGPWVFPGRFGNHVCAATVWSWVVQVAEEAGMGYVSTHVLRHTALATANDNTGDLRSVQAFAGHQDPAVTAGYTRATKHRLVEVMQALDY